MKKNTWAVLLREYLLPGAAEQDEGFQEEVLRIGHKGLRAVGGVEMGVALFLAAGRLIAVPLPASFRLRILEAASPFILGAATIALSRAQALYTWSRAVAWASCAAAAASLSWVSLLWRDRQGGADFILGPITALLLVAVAAIPLRPAHTLALGCFAGGSYALLAAWVEPQGGGHPAFTIFAAFLTLLATVLTAVIYGERRASYESWVRTVRAFEELRQAQSRILLSENAASLGRLAAALSHELNSPLGALMSGVDTLVLVAARQALSPPSEQERLVRLQADLRGSVRESAGRLQQIIERMQRFTNLDRAEVQEVDLNGLKNVCPVTIAQLSSMTASANCPVMNPMRARVPGVPAACPDSSF
ncbi:MAG: hypothetical protein LAQ30_21200, partial [Acidobacteriia bacterium]|nr:hypothetical protein [Terriglobia bacterium]